MKNDIEDFVATVKGRNNKNAEGGENSTLDIAKHVAGILRKVLATVKGKEASIQTMMLHVKYAPSCLLTHHLYTTSFTPLF